MWFTESARYYTTGSDGISFAKCYYSLNKRSEFLRFSLSSLYFSISNQRNSEATEKASALTASAPKGAIFVTVFHKILLISQTEVHIVE
jgi:hypothetical protein